MSTFLFWFVFRGSHILGKSVRLSHPQKPPTPLHEVGTWRRPLDPSCAVKVRLTDAAIQAFAATFGLKSGQEQQEAMDMLESLVPPLLMQLARSLGMTAALTDQNFRSKVSCEIIYFLTTLMGLTLICFRRKRTVLLLKTLQQFYFLVYRRFLSTIRLTTCR